MNKAFKFPPSGDGSPEIPTIKATQSPPRIDVPERLDGADTRSLASTVITPTNVEVPPPPPMDKERVDSHSIDDGDDDVGETVEIAL